jgi:GTP cyclohydrolase II
MALTHLQIKDLLDENRDHDCPGVGEEHVCVRIAAIADLPSRFGNFHIVAFWNKRDKKEHVAIVHGDPTESEDVPVRMHSECLTGDALGSLRCDCRDQLETSLRMIAEMEKGIVLYLRQEGRGIGLVNKIRAYGLQDYGFDTVEANIALGFRDDEREYSSAAHMLHSLKVKSVQLITNNPRKIDDLTSRGINVTGRIPLVIPPNPYNRFYLETKAAKSGHLIDFAGKEHMQEQMDRPIVAGMTTEQIDQVQHTHR